jgi:hypothetical protein
MAGVKLYMTLEDQRMGIASYQSTLARIGVSITSIPSEGVSVLPLTDRATLNMVGHQGFMPQESLDKILNKDRLHETGLPTLPTTVVALPYLAPPGTFVKSRNSVVGGYVYQPQIAFPHEDLDIHFSVNAQGRVHVIAAHRHQHLGGKKPGTLRMATTEECGDLVSHIEAACQALEIKGGMHDVAFLMHEGVWKAIDWNPRAPFLYTDGVAAKYPCLDGAIAHMLGLPLPNIAPAVFVNRAYWDRPIPLNKRSVVESFGLTPRRDEGRQIDGFVRVNGVGVSEADVNSKFDAMEAAL